MLKYVKMLFRGYVKIHVFFLKDKTYFVHSEQLCSYVFPYVTMTQTDHISENNVISQLMLNGTSHMYTSDIVCQAADRR